MFGFFKKKCFFFLFFVLNFTAMAFFSYVLNVTLLKCVSMNN